MFFRRRFFWVRGRRWMGCWLRCRFRLRLRSGLCSWFGSGPGLRFRRGFRSCLSGWSGSGFWRCLRGWSGCLPRRCLGGWLVRRCWSSRLWRGMRGRLSSSRLGCGSGRGWSWPCRSFGTGSGLRLGRGMGCGTGCFGCLARRLRCGSGMGGSSRMGRSRSRTRGNVWLDPRSGLGSHGAVLQLSDVCRWLRHGGMSGNSMIRRSKISLVLLGNLHMLLLSRSRLQVRLAGEGLLLRCRSRAYSVWAAVEAGVSVVDDGGVIDDGLIDVDVPDHGGVHVYGCGVIGENAASPLTTGEAAATVAEAVVHSSVVADLGSPVAFIEGVNSVVPAPITWGPEIAGLGRFNPGAGNPIVVTDAVPGPVAGRPHEVGLRARRLNVDRKSGRSNVDADADAELCNGCGRH